MRNKQKGFSLIELLIVVAIILIIAAIAIPNLLRAKMAANEASAVGSLRTINTSCVAYSTSYGIGFPGSLTNLGPIARDGTASSTSADLIDSVLSAGSQERLHLRLCAGADTAGNQHLHDYGDAYCRGQTGQRMFFTDQSGVIRADVFRCGRNR